MTDKRTKQIYRVTLLGMFVNILLFAFKKDERAVGGNGADRNSFDGEHGLFLPFFEDDLTQSRGVEEFIQLEQSGVLLR